MSKRLISLLCVLLLTGCSLLPSGNEQPDLQLLSPASGPAAQLQQQRLTFRMAGRTLQLLAVVRQQPERVQLVALTATGQPLLELNYDGERLEQSTPVALELPGTEVLALMQLALWPDTALQQAYAEDKGWQLEVAPQWRQLSYRHNPIVEVRYDNAGISLEHLMAGYQIEVEVLKQVKQ